MILNSYAVLVAFVGIVRLVLALLAVILAVRAFRQSGARDETGDRFYLLLLLAISLIGLNFASWPLIYLLLQSYVSEFPGVMCIYGVTRIGEGSLGPARYLPGLVALLQITKPALVFAGGAWLTLYLLNRRCAAAPLLPRLLLLMTPLGALAAVDSAAELTYVALPKTEDLPTAGCCTVDRNENRFLPRGFTKESERRELSAAFYGGTALLLLGIALSTRQPRLMGRGTLTLLLIAAAVLTSVGGVFVVDVAAPRLLHLPLHHCPYDLLPRTPEAVVPIALYLGGSFCVGWAWVVAVFGSHVETVAFRADMIRWLLRASLWCYLTAMCMLSFELALA